MHIHRGEHELEKGLPEIGSKCFELPNTEEYYDVDDHSANENMHKSKAKSFLKHTSDNLPDQYSFFHLQSTFFHLQSTFIF